MARLFLGWSKPKRRVRQFLDSGPASVERHRITILRPSVGKIEVIDLITACCQIPPERLLMLPDNRPKLHQGTNIACITAMAIATQIVYLGLGNVSAQPGCAECSLLGVSFESLRP